MSKYKLSKFKKAGIAVGLTIAITAGASLGGFVKAIYDAANPKYTHSGSSKPSTSASTSTSTAPQIQSDYIDMPTKSEINNSDQSLETIPVTLDNYSLLNFLDTLNSSDFSFDMSQYYGLEQALELYNSTTINKSTTSDLLDASGKLDPDKLIQKVYENNKNYMSQGKNAINTFYKDLDRSDISKICTLIAEVVNSNYNGIEVNKVANTLTKLTMFKKEGSASNAYVNESLTFIYNPSMTGMYADMKEITGEYTNKEDALKSVITHEIMHILEYSASDNNNENGIEAGICRMYNVPNKDKKIAVDSLWNSWLLEAAAELGMSDYLNIPTGTYAKKISYVRSYNLSNFNNLASKNEALENIAFSPTLEEAFQTLNITEEKDKLEFLKFLYSVEITQTDPKEFWDNYTSQTGITPTEDEKTGLRMDIRQEAVKYLSRNFYTNLATAISEQKVKDLDTAFYLMRTWELDTYSHLEYTKTSALPHATDFIKWHDTIQSSLFQALGESNSMDPSTIADMYSNYSLEITGDNETYKNCDLSSYSEYTENQILSAKDNYNTSHFASNKDALAYLEKNSTEKAENTINPGQK